ncbi:MAG: SpoIIE family protein phosphatase [Gammaproteobacteria bacterium]|nr:SpoIIE family protein phosphatase [Gammaproteobacteria bacterium]
MLELFNKITTSGIEEKTQTNNFIVATNTGALLAWIITFPYLFIYFLIKEYSLFFFTVGILFLYPLPILINAYKYYRTAKIVFMNIGYTHVTVISIYFGIVSGFELYFYLLPVLALLLFSPKERFVLIAMILLFWLYYFITQFGYEMFEPKAVSPIIAKLFYYSTILFVFIYITGFTLLFRLNSLKLQNELNHKLDDIKGLLTTVEEEKNKNTLLLNSIGEGVFGVGKDGLVNFINPAGLELLGYQESELLHQKIQPIIHHTHTDGSQYLIEDCPMNHAVVNGKVSHIDNELLWRKDGTSFPSEYSARPIMSGGQIMGAVITFVDITEKIEAKERLISEIADRKQSETIAQHAKQRLENITNNIPGVVFQFQVIDNRTFAKFISEGIKLLQYIDVEDITKDFSVFMDSIYEPDREIVYGHIFKSMETLNPIDCDYRIKTSNDEFRWIHMAATASVLSNQENDVMLFDIDETNTNIILNGNLVDVTDAKIAHNVVVKQQKELASIHKHTKDSIEYASLIQGAIVPDNKVFSKYFTEYFTLWKPKDIVGGDIYLVEEVSEDEIILMVIDCTGHGVPGAFVTMLVKAVERQIIAEISNNKFMRSSPARILEFFNINIKRILNQEDDESISNAGFDGGILYYNKKKQYMKFAGAETPLFYVEEGKLNIIKGDRHSIGYKKSDAYYKFKEHKISVQAGMQIYLTTDGYLDQNGGDKGFPFGKKRFKALIEEHHNFPMASQKDIFINAISNYQGTEERNDDITVVGLKFAATIPTS